MATFYVKALLKVLAIQQQAEQLKFPSVKENTFHQNQWTINK